MYCDKIIHSANLRNYEDYIPVNYHDQIKKGELSAVATYEGEPEDDKLIGVSVTGSHAGWLEIVWVAMADWYRQDVKTADFLRYVIRRGKKSNSYVGVFCEVHMDENTLLQRDILMLSGMELKEAKNNIYEIALLDVEHEDMLYAAAEKVDCTFLEEAPDELLEMAEEAIEEDERPIPAPAYFERDLYVQELSLVCCEDGKPVGLLLFSEAKDYLVLELAYSASAKAMPGMIGTALRKAKELYPPDKRILMPIVGKGAAELIARIAPQAHRGDIVEAVAWFKDRKVSKSLRFIMDKMKGK